MNPEARRALRIGWVAQYAMHTFTKDQLLLWDAQNRPKDDPIFKLTFEYSRTNMGRTVKTTEDYTHAALNGILRKLQPCRYCGKPFYVPDELIEHMITHRGMEQ